MKVGLLVAVFPLLFLFGTALSTVKDNRPQTPPAVVSDNFSNPEAENSVPLPNNPIIHASSSEKTVKSAVITRQDPAVTLPKEPAKEQTVATVSPEPSKPEVKLASAEKPISQVRCPNGAYLDASTTDVCPPTEVEPDPIDLPLPCRLVSLDHVSLPIGVCDKPASTAS